VYRKDFVTGTRDIPNRYAMGSTVVIDNETNTVTKDGLNKNSDIVQGSHHFLSVPPGESELDIYFSSWIKKMPTVKVEFENRSL
ncbi:TPA: phage tail family protein, partial [Streptococcus pyogenes]|nr:phage tail family protein [Streptococcus pyogenes]